MVGQGKTIICLVGFKAMNRPINKQCIRNVQTKFKKCSIEET
ncbi:Uncharacterized protein BM_BM1349 [Brugia malayi]|uniref:Bm1349 n=1 Tax=Brugia malayi TaxID=6279 RepID=A0A0K0IXZ4_BRUMA|nr:Uncharacterized protein BM_BM1349 [Brugia malayi]CDP96495.1 Bm1349 [Brugia malayi]VIO98227.1 Uncharacterized protein BM_BM1349 [Brugia malayi]